MKTYKAAKSYTAEANTLVDTFSISDFVGTENNIKDAWINAGGWQSWNPGFEVEPGKKQPSLKCHLVKGWNTYLVFPQSTFKASKKLVLAQFVTYLRWNDLYLVFASLGNVDDELPPVQFIINRKKASVSVEIADKGKKWTDGQIQSKIEIFTAESYFEVQEKLKKLFSGKQFNKIESLGSNPVGWESWYNHYSHINEKLILDDLKALKETHNIISKGNYSSVVFQIDDGWEIALGDWDYRKDRFPNGLKSLVESIENENYIPGLWIAPFIIDSRSKTAQAHKDWLLQDENGQLIVSGFNPLWGDKGNFYCLDLSNEEVIAHLDTLMEKAVNEWGFRYLKLDFLYAGMFYGAFKNPDAAYIHYINAMKVLTSRTQTKEGKPVVYLGCGIPFEPSFNYFPLSRIGCDTYEHWENKLPKALNWNGRNSAYLNIKDTLGHALWNKTIFANDPDVLFVRNENCSLTHEEKLLIAKVDILFGSQLMYSDDPAKSTSEEEKNLTNEILDFINQFKDEEFAVKQTAAEVYQLQSKSDRYKGEINLGKEHYIKITENK